MYGSFLCKTTDEQNERKIKENNVTTLEQIEVCPKQNWEFWTERARLSLACYRENQKCRFSKLGFRRNLEHRKNQTFLNDELKKRSMATVGGD